METLRLIANGVDFTVRAWGEGPRLALLLHGFPDDADSMAPLAQRLVAAGYRCAAPFQRGYAPSGPAPHGDYHLTALADDIATLVPALGYADALVVGHDWGAAATYAAVAARPERIRRAVGLSVPPPVKLLGNLRRDPVQLRRSAYMARFQVPGAAARIRKGGFAEIDRLWREWSPGWTPPPERLAAVKATLATPGCIEAAIEYYRALVPRRPGDWVRARAVLRRPRRPLLVLAGRTDGCMGPGVYAGVSNLVLLNGGHFLPLEAPDAVADAVIAFDRG